METILSDLNKFQKVGIKKRIFNFLINHQKTSTIICRDLKNQEVCLPNNIRKLKQQREVDQEFYIDFVKRIKPLLMFVHHLDLYFLQLEVLVTHLQNFQFLNSPHTFNEFTVGDYSDFVEEIVQQDNKLFISSLEIDSSLIRMGINKQPPEMFFKKRFSQKFCKIHRKTRVPELQLY